MHESLKTQNICFSSLLCSNKCDSVVRRKYAVARRHWSMVAVTITMSHSDPASQNKTPLPNASFTARWFFGTPQKPKLAHDFGSLSGKLESTCLDLVSDTGPVTKVKFKQFVKQVLPPLDARLANIEGQVLGNGTSTMSSLITGTPSRWKHFPTDPSQTTGTENQVFKPLVGLWDDIIKVAENSVKPPPVPIIIIAQNLNQSQASEHPNSSCPDGVTLLKETTIVTAPVPTKIGRESWEDTACPWQYKKTKSRANSSDVRGQRLHFYLVANKSHLYRTW